MSARWQYKVEQVKVTAWGTLRLELVEERLQKLGQQGWELVNAVHAGQWGPTVLFLKRPG